MELEKNAVLPLWSKGESIMKPKECRLYSRLVKIAEKLRFRTVKVKCVKDSQFIKTISFTTQTPYLRKVKILSNKYIF